MKPKFTPNTIFAIDFDGTCVTHEFPKVGKDCPYAVDVLKLINEHGGKLILWTMRCNHTEPPMVTETHNDTIVQCEPDNYLDNAVDWFSNNNIQLWHSQTNPDQINWTLSPKCYAHIYIDDAALGCPLTIDKEISERPFVNWSAIKEMLFDISS